MRTATVENPLSTKELFVRIRDAIKQKWEREHEIAPHLFLLFDQYTWNRDKERNLLQDLANKYKLKIQTSMAGDKMGLPTDARVALIMAVEPEDKYSHNVFLGLQLVFNGDNDRDMAVNFVRKFSEQSPGFVGFQLISAVYKREGGVLVEPKEEALLAVAQAVNEKLEVHLSHIERANGLVTISPWFEADSEEENINPVLDVKRPAELKGDIIH